MSTYQTGARSGRQAAPAKPIVHAPHAALLIDFDNVTLGIRSDLTKELRTLLNSDIIKGKVAVQRAYADWRRYPQYIVPLSESSIDLIFAPAFGTNKKNATDIRLAVDAIELVFTRQEIGTFILLSGDSDFSSLVIKLKEYGKYVIGVGIRESASDLLIQNCDEYFSYSDLAGLTKEVDVPSIQRDPWELVVEAVAQMARNDDVMRSDRLKQVMQQLDPNFDEKNAGFNRFSKFITEAGNRRLVKVAKLDNGQYEVAPMTGAVAPAAKAAEPPRAAGAPAPERKEREDEGRRGRGRGRRGRGRERDEGAEPRPRPPARAAGGALTLAEAFQAVQRALHELPLPVVHDKLRARMLVLLGREDPLLEPARFVRLLRQAHDAEVAEVRKTDGDDYEVTLRGAELATKAASDAKAAAAAPAPAPEIPDAAAEQARRLAAVRFRRGSRGPVRVADVPLVGAVKVEAETTPVEDTPAAKSAPAKGRRTRSRKKSTAKAATPRAEAPGAKAAPAEAGQKPKAASRARSRKSTAKSGAKKAAPKEPAKE